MANERQTNFEELCAGYVLDSLSEKDEEEFLSMLDVATAQEKQLLEDMKAIAAEIAQLVPVDKPSEKIRELLIQKAWESLNAPTGRNIFYLNRFRYAVAASFILLLSSVGLYFYSQNLNETLVDQQELVSQKDIRIQTLLTEVQQKEALLTILEARDVDLVLMDGLDVNPNGYGKVVWDKDNGRALLQVANLPVVPSESDYQLWIIINNQPISAGVFAVNNPDDDDFFTIENLTDDTDSGAFAITLEPKGGSQQPTGDMYLLGALN